ncbi:hypothetical protein [Serratia marcescens]|uniref:hypothetical protein n=1 Tax=Serratia marcescens TaxID=615 RepID=UPI003F86BF13
MLLTLVGVLLVWLGITLVLMGGLLVSPRTVIARPPVSPTERWGRRCLAFLRGEWGVWGTLRAGLALSGALWWYRAAGLPLPVRVLDNGVVLLGGVFLVVLFNAGSRQPLSPWGEGLLCGTLGAAWVGLLAFFMLYAG